MSAEYLLMEAPCGQCLTSRDRIVSGERAAELVRGCRETNTKFICHKTSGTACAGVHRVTGGCLAFRFAQTFGIPITLIDPATLERKT